MILEIVELKFTLVNLNYILFKASGSVIVNVLVWLIFFVFDGSMKFVC